MTTSQGTAQISWEYLMPKKKERMLGYVRESDPTLANSTTIESQAKAIREYGQRQGYLYDPQHEFMEAISAYKVPYMEREQLLSALEVCKRHAVDVFVVTEVRAISRRQVEVFIIYDMLQKYGIRLETINEKFEDDAMGRIILGLRAGYAEIEREQSYQRMQRGKKDRIAIGKAPNGHPKAAYGYVFLDGEKEVKATYLFKVTVIYVDVNGVEWSEYSVCVFIFDLLRQGESLNAIARQLNEIGIPPPKKAVKGEPHWNATTVRRIAKNPIYAGIVWANRWKREGKKVIERPQEEWKLLPPGTAPAIIDLPTFELIQEQLVINKQDSLRNNKNKEIGLLRAGYCRCGICNRSMYVAPPSLAAAKKGGTPYYYCEQKTGSRQGTTHNHNTTIHLPLADKAAWEKVCQTLENPLEVRAAIEERRRENKRVANPQEVTESLCNIEKEMENLFELARHATNDSTRTRLGLFMEELEKQKQQAESFLHDIEDDESGREEIEAEIARFEKWVSDVRPRLINPESQADIPYEEKRLAIRVLGIRMTVYPVNGSYPFRYRLDVTVPKIMAKVRGYSSNHT